MPNASVAAAASGLPNRRSILAGAAAALAVPTAAVATASPLDELIADYRLACEEEEALFAEFGRIDDSTEIPLIAVRYGSRRRQDPDTGEVTFSPWVFSTVQDIDKHFDALRDSWHVRHQPEFVPEVEARRATALADYHAQKLAQDEARRASGLAAAALLADQALFRMLDIRREIFAYRPATLSEVATKNAFLLELVSEGINLRDDLAVIFGTAARG